MQPHTDLNTNDTLADWPSLVEFKQSRFTGYDPATDADADAGPDKPSTDTLDFVCPD